MLRVGTVVITLLSIDLLFGSAEATCNSCIVPGYGCYCAISGSKSDEQHLREVRLPVCCGSSFGTELCGEQGFYICEQRDGTVDPYCYWTYIDLYAHTPLISYGVNSNGLVVNGTTLSTNKLKSWVDDTIERWETPHGHPLFSGTYTTTRVANFITEDGYNTISGGRLFGGLGGTSLLFVSPMYSRGPFDQCAKEQDIMIATDPPAPWGGSPDACPTQTQLDIMLVITHELGHTLGVDHLQEFGSNLIMYEYPEGTDARGLCKRTITGKDLEYVYEANDLSAFSCSP
ncbi:MAG: hypothetical protein HYY20_06795 [Candidatus Tectomicrobia bacterium]|uniref:Peptidase M10 metallopeptidase domain-containing protein n=1 Tax=Tectimicrobiota bacterium TaxID=2528274 RepID=A0A932CNX6_UNCTE|nr:hypothetical protein [Candidatus Tectomicrobia bacterium]